MNFTDNTTFNFINNFSPTLTGYAEGGAMTAFQSTINFLGLCSFINNSAEDGGAILATDSKLNIILYICFFMTIPVMIEHISFGDSQQHCQEKR